MISTLFQLYFFIFIFIFMLILFVSSQRRTVPIILGSFRWSRFIWWNNDSLLQFYSNFLMWVSNLISLMYSKFYSKTTKLTTTTTLIFLFIKIVVIMTLVCLIPFIIPLVRVMSRYKSSIIFFILFILEFWLFFCFLLFIFKLLDVHMFMTLTSLVTYCYFWFSFGLDSLLNRCFSDYHSGWYVILIKPGFHDLKDQIISSCKINDYIIEDYKIIFSEGIYNSFYDDIMFESYFERNRNYLLSGPINVLVCSKNLTYVTRNKSLIRSTYGLDPTRNAIHSSDSVNRGRYEYNLLSL